MIDRIQYVMGSEWQSSGNREKMVVTAVGKCFVTVARLSNREATESIRIIFIKVNGEGILSISIMGINVHIFRLELNTQPWLCTTKKVEYGRLKVYHTR